MEMEVEGPGMNDRSITFRVATYSDMMSTIVGVMDAVGDPDEEETPADQLDVLPSGSDPPAANEAAEPTGDNVDPVPDEGQAEGRRTLKCSLCPRTFPNYAEYNNHVDTHIRMRDSRYVCDFCNKEFPNFDRITVHLYARHKRGLPKTCSVCFRTFNNKRALNKHKRSRHPTPPPPPPRRNYPPGHPRMHRRLLTYLVSSDSPARREDSVVFPDRIVETHTRAPNNTPQGNSNGFHGDDNTGEYVRHTTPRDINVGRVNVRTHKEGTASVGTDTDGIASVETVSVGTEYVDTASVGTDNVGMASVDTDNVGTASVGNDNVGTASVGNDNVGTDNVGTDNVGTDNVGTDNVGTDNMDTANVGTDKVDTNNVDNATTGNGNQGTSSDGIFRIKMM